MTTEESVAIVTGAAQGIGKTIATCLLSQDYQVFLFDIDSDLGNVTAKQLQLRFGDSKVSFVHCDVADEELFTDAFNTVVKKCSHISVIVNNAGIADEHNIQRCININLTGVIVGSNLAIRNMRKDQGGKGGIVVNISSMAAFVPHHSLPTYCATKSGVISFTRSWAMHPKCEELGLTFMCLCPGFVDTELVKHGSLKTLDPAAFDAAKKTMELLPVETIGTGFQKLMSDTMNGAVLEVSAFKTEYVIDPTKAV